jgi:acetyl-CoA acetyltransferase
MRDVAAVAGIGETDYAEDYSRARAGGNERYEDVYGYAALAFKRALADAGIDRDELDGLVAGPTVALERVGEVLGIDPVWATQADAANAVMAATMAIHCGLAECIALVYANDQRTGGSAYGGPAAAGDRFLAYVYYAPWGLTSQGALYALAANRYMSQTDFRPEDLAEVAISQRRFAALNPRAVMRAPLDLDAYMASTFVCEPFRLFDYCLVNDGGVAMILTSAERARRLDNVSVLVSGFGRSDMNATATSLRPRLVDFYRPAHRRAAAQAADMSGLGPEDVDILQIYDSFSVHVPVALEGFGFAKEGGAAGLIRDGGIGPGGKLPVNTSGGHLSESYMQGWNHQVEIVRQLRREAGERQVEDARVGQYVADAAGKTQAIVYRREGA